MAGFSVTTLLQFETKSLHTNAYIHTYIHIFNSLFSRTIWIS